MADPRKRGPRARPRRSGIPSVIASTRLVDTAAARAAAAARHERRTGAVLELDLDKCRLNFGATNSFGTCPATGTPCYNTFGTCKAKANYRRGTYTWRFCSRGMRIPAGEPLRPYIEGLSLAPAEIDMAKGLAIRSRISIALRDEPDSDVEDDPYALTTRGGYALSFDGADDRVTIPDGLIGPLTTGSLEAWFQTTSHGVIFGVTDLAYPAVPSGWVPQLYVGTDGILRGVFWNSTAELVASVAAVNDGVRHHAVITANGGSYSLYLDGALVDTKVHTVVGFGTKNYIGLGYDLFWPAGTGWHFFNGIIDGCRIYSRELSAPEIADRYLLGKYAGESGLVAHWKFDEGTGVTAADASGNANHGTLVNGPIWVPGLAPIPPAQGTYWTRLLARTKNYAGRAARVKRGFVTEPWSWDTFQTEHYIIESIKGPDGQGRFRVELSDTIRLLDSVQIPSATDGKLAGDLLAVSNTGTAQAGSTAGSIKLAAAASTADDFYNGQEVLILQNTGAGQRRVISDYVGATRVATISPDWAVTPDATSTYEVVPLSLTLDAGKGVKYPDPAGTGRREFVKIDDEVIAYTAKAGDVLSWPDGTYRAQGGTARADHKQNAGVQLCEAFINQTPIAAIRRILNKGMISDELTDLAGLEAEADDWLSGVVLNVFITTPETASSVLQDLLFDLNLFAWWDPVSRLIRFKANMPAIASSISLLTDDELIGGATQAEPMDAERITRAAIYYNPRSATLNLKEAKNFTRGEIAIDTDAESPDEYGDVRQETRYSRWLTSGNGLFAGARVARLVGRRRNAPLKLKFQLDPRNEVQLGDLVDVTSRAIVGPTGAPVPTRMRITKKQDAIGHLVLEARTTNLGKRYFFIGPPGLPDYADASEAQRQYGFICDANGLMSDGTKGYVIA